MARLMQTGWNIYQCGAELLSHVRKLLNDSIKAMKAKADKKAVTDKELEESVDEVADIMRKFEYVFLELLHKQAFELKTALENDIKRKKFNKINSYIAQIRYIEGIYRRAITLEMIDIQKAKTLAAYARNLGKDLEGMIKEINKNITQVTTKITAQLPKKR